MRKRISSELKGKVAIAALQGHRTVNEIASEYELPIKSIKSILIYCVIYK